MWSCWVLAPQPSFLLAAAHPERIDRLVLLNPSARLLRGDDYPQGFPAEPIERRLERSRHEAVHWWAAPSLRGNPRFDQWYERCVHLSATPEHRYWRNRSSVAADFRSVLSAIRAPTLVLRRGGTEAEHAQTDYVAAHITGAKTVLLPGQDALFFAGDPGPLLDAIAEFVAGRHAAVDTDRVLATVMFTDIVDSTDHVSRVRDRHWSEVLSAHERIVRAELERFRGHEVKSMGDGVLATFDGPGRAFRCAAGIRDAVTSLGSTFASGSTPAKSNYARTTSPESQSTSHNESKRWPIPARFSPRAPSSTWSQVRDSSSPTVEHTSSRASRANGNSTRSTPEKTHPTKPRRFSTRRSAARR